MIRLCLSVVLGLFLTSVQAQTNTLPALTGPVILTVAGLDAQTYPDGQVELDLGRLQTIGISRLETSSIWTTGVHRYSGVMMRDLIDFLNIDGTTLRLHALNDYAVEIPASEVTAEAPILAFDADGVAMSVRDKGPIWVMYPYDASAKYRTDITFSRSIWQLDRIDVLN